MDSIPDEVWRWVRGELPDEKSEQWLHAQGSGLERAMGQRVYLDAFELDFRDPYAVSSMRQRLAAQLPRSCVCPLMLNRQRLPLTVATRSANDSPFLALFERVCEAANGAELWRCRRCGSYWSVVLDSDADN